MEVQIGANFLSNPPFYQARNPHSMSNVFLDTQQTQHATSDMSHQSLYTYLETGPSLPAPRCGGRPH